MSRSNAKPASEVSPRKARRLFLEARKGNVKQSSYRTYKFPTKHFVEYCEQEGIEGIGEVGGYVIESWKQARKEEDIKQVTLFNNVKTLRVFIRWCEHAELIDYGTADRIQVPEVTEEQVVSDDRLSTDMAEQTLEYLDTYEYASRQHALFKTLWHTGCRISGAIALDLDDVELGEEPPIIKFVNRPDTGTSLKNNNGGERNVSITEDVVNVLTDYIEGKRPDVTDEFDREPLFCTEENRIERQRAYKNFTALTRPCYVSNTCPHDRDIEGCDAAQYKKEAMKCPSSESLHPIRRGSITYQVSQGWPIRSSLAHRGTQRRRTRIVSN